MSLVSTWVLFQDGKFYQNPVLYTEDWFLCFDDEDPPELVIRVEKKKQRKSVYLEMTSEILGKLGVVARVTMFRGGSQRCFPPNWKEFSDAVGCALHIEHGTAMPIMDDMISQSSVEAEGGTYGLTPKGVGQCTFYNFGLGVLENPDGNGKGKK